MNRIRLAVLFGGVSNEHEVSLMSAASILAHLDPSRYEISRVGITKDGRWFLYDGGDEKIADGSWADDPSLVACHLSPDRSIRGLILLRGGAAEIREVDAVFPVLHGRGGEDGSVQGLCALAGLPCVGCGVVSSAVCMDKEFTHRVLHDAGIPGAKWIAVRRSEAGDLARLGERIAAAGLCYPLFCKPANSGSSVGISKAHGADELPAALAAAFAEDDKAILEETLCGAEVECAVMGNDDPVAAEAVGEIEPLRELYDYEGKYRDNSTVLHIPARIPDEAARRVRETAARAYRALGCAGLARVDFFVRQDGAVFLNEVNTMPGFTSISMFPKLFCHGGMTLSALVDRLVGSALGR